MGTPIRGKSNDDVLAIGLNATFPKAELPGLQRAVAATGGKVIAIAQPEDAFWHYDPKKPNDAPPKCQLTTVVDGQETTLDLLQPEGISAFARSLRLPAAAEQQVMLAMHDSEIGTRDELAQLAQVLAKGERGEPIPSRLLISGHGTGSTIGSSGENNGTLKWSSVGALTRAMPTGAGQIEDLMVATCNGGGEAVMLKYRAIFPNLKTIWAYVETAPGAASGAERHMQLWAKATAGPTEHLDREVARGTRKGENVAVWQRAETEKGLYSCKWDDAPLEELIADYESSAVVVLPAAMRGDWEEPDPQTGLLRDVYNGLNTVLARPELPTDQRATYEALCEQVIRLIYYPKVSEKFAAKHGAALAAAYSAAGLPVPDFATRSRKQMLEDVARLEGAASSPTLSADQSVQVRAALALLTKGLRDLDPSVIPQDWL